MHYLIEIKSPNYGKTEQRSPEDEFFFGIWNDETEKFVKIK